MSTDIQPVFVVGRHRSGTTWVTNVLAANERVFTPEDRLHQGQHESAFFSSLVPYCRMGAREADRRAIGAIFERSDYWYLLFPDNPPVIDIEQAGITNYFSEVMDEAAKRRGCSFWLENTPAHTVVLRDLIHAYPYAYFIAVQRAPLDVVHSNVHRSPNPKQLRRWIQAAIWTEVYQKILSIHRKHLRFVVYEDLVSNFAEEVAGLFEYIGLDASSVQNSRYEPNSSFSSVKPKIAWQYRAVVRFIQLAFGLLPAGICEWAARIRMKNRRHLPLWFFKIFKGASKS